MRALLLGAAVALAACTAAPAPSAPPAPPSPSPSVAAPRQVSDPGKVTGTLTGPCHARDGGQLPDPACTPGSYDAAITTAVLCAPGYTTRSYRPPSSQTANFKYGQAYPAYGIPDHPAGELDHLISLELGGSNDASNLWPEPGSIPNPKDRVENVLHDAVCTGKVSLHAAQTAIAADWMTAEHALGIT